MRQKQAIPLSHISIFKSELKNHPTLISPSEWHHPLSSCASQKTVPAILEASFIPHNESITKSNQFNFLIFLELTYFSPSSLPLCRPSCYQAFQRLPRVYPCSALIHSPRCKPDYYFKIQTQLCHIYA